jgi:hypothetical protein
MRGADWLKEMSPEREPLRDVTITLIGMFPRGMEI